MIKEFRFIEEKPVIIDKIDTHGREVVDRTPVKFELPDKRFSMLDYIEALYRARQAEDAETETLEEANDFDCPEEYGLEDMKTPYEMAYDNYEMARMREQDSPPAAENPGEPVSPVEGS